MSRLRLAIVLSLLPLLAQAQPHFGLAFKGGPNSAINNIDNREHRYGLSGGLAGNLRWQLPRPPLLGGQFELLYTPRGANTVFEGEDLGWLRQHYIDVVFAIRPEARIGPASIYLLLGGSWDLLLSAKRYGKASGITDDVTDLASRHDVALLVGVGVALHLPSRRVGPFRLDTAFVEARHDRGLIDFDDTTDTVVKNRTTSLMLGVSFALDSRGAPSGSPSK
jgi:hypothetical protein